jgi:hypothetical protein
MAAARLTALLFFFSMGRKKGQRYEVYGRGLV